MAAVISGIGSAIFFALNLEPFKTLFVFIFGSIFSTVIQKRLQNDAEKRSKNREYVETYYGPLLITLQEIRRSIFEEAFLSDVDIGKLHEFQSKPQIFTMGEKLRLKFITIINDVYMANRELPYYTQKIRKLICEKGYKYLEKRPDGQLQFNPDTGSSPIWLKYEYNAGWTSKSLEACIILDKEPMEIIKERVRDFHEKGLSVSFELQLLSSLHGWSREVDQKPYSERQGVLNNIITEVRSELAQDKGYTDFKSHLDSLKEKLQSLTSSLSSHVEKYVSTVEP